MQQACAWQSRVESSTHGKASCSYAYTPAAAWRHSRRSVTVNAAKGFGALIKKSQDCPCGSGKEYKVCCQRYHQNITLKAPTAEEVLRARFSAYNKREWKYIVRTTHPDNAATKGSASTDGKIRTTFEEDIKVSMYNFNFKTLQVVSVQPGATSDEQVIEVRVDVEQKIDDKGRKLDKPLPRSIHETALFVRTPEGAWEFLRALDSNWARDKLDYVQPQQQASATAQ